VLVSGDSSVTKRGGQFGFRGKRASMENQYWIRFAMDFLRTIELIRFYCYYPLCTTVLHGLNKGDSECFLSFHAI
jgi:hypothetical protein